MLENDVAFFIFVIKEVHRLKRKTISEVGHTLFKLMKEECKYISSKKACAVFWHMLFLKEFLDG